MAPHSPPPKPRLHAYLTTQIRTDTLLEAQLLLLTLATGIQDAATWPDYTCFASNQTGNTLFLTIAAAGLSGDAYSPRNAAMSLGMFIAGGLVLGQLGLLLGERTRIWLIISNLVQTLLILVALVLQYTLPLRTEGPIALSVIACLAFSSGGQVAMTRSLKVTEITTAMATAAFVDVVVDPGMLKRKNRMRNRRVGFLVALAVGCLIGAFATRRVASSFALLWCLVGKGLVMVSFLFNKGVVKEGVEHGLGVQEV
ncbi:YoaK family protein [Aspergillus stella-maris]|uniref:YoaK family protein n=1 Tax=Aspergillus stella-maris TaxID=1810926 RepID=UPI003CCD7ED4